MTAIAIDLLVNATTSQANKNIKTLTGNVDDLGDEVERTNQKMAGLGKGIKVGLAAAGVAAAAGVVAVGAALGSSVKAGADAQAMMGKFNVVFGDTAGTAEKVRTELDTFARQAGRSKYALREMASGFGDMLTPLGFSVEEAGGLSTAMTQLAVDLGSYEDMAPEEAFERLSSTLIGNHANALRFGVIINEAVLKEELLRMGADQLTGSLLEQAKVQARINLLYAGTTNAQGDAIRTSDEWNNQMVKLEGVLKDVRTEIGMKLLPVLSPFLEAIGELAGALLPKAAEAFAGFVDQIDVEKLKTDLKTFVDELLEGDFVLGPIEIQFEKPGQDGPMWERQFLPDETTLIDLADHFTWDSQKWLDDNLKESTLTIGGKVLFGEEAGDLVIETATVNGVVVSRKASLGELFEGEWTEDSGLTLTIGGVKFFNEGEYIDDALVEWGTKTSAALDLAFGASFLTLKEKFVGLELPEFPLPTWWSDPDFTKWQLPEWWEDGPFASWENPFPVAEDGSIDLSAWLPEIEDFAGWGEWLDDWLPVVEKFVTWGFVFSGWLPFVTLWPGWGKWLDPWLPNVPSFPGWSTLISRITGGGASVGAGYAGGGTDPERVRGDDGNATGTGFFPGGGTWVGETGPEFIMAPRGASIYPAGYASQMAASGAGGPTININATVANEFDAHVLAQQVAAILQRRGR